MYPNWFENWQAELQGLCPSCKRFHSVSSVTKMLLVFSWRQGKKLMLFPPFTVLRASAGWSCLANILLGRGDLKAWWDPSRERNHWEKYKRWLKPLSVHGNCQPPSHQCPQFHWAWLGLPSSWTALFWHSIYPQLYCKNHVSYNLKQARCLLKKWRVISLLQKHLQLLHDPIFPFLRKNAVKQLSQVCSGFELIFSSEFQIQGDHQKCYSRGLIGTAERAVNEHSARTQCTLKLLASWAAFFETQEWTPVLANKSIFGLMTQPESVQSLSLGTDHLYTWVSHKSQNTAWYQIADFQMPMNFFTKGMKCFLLIPVCNTAEHATGIMIYRNSKPIIYNCLETTSLVYLQLLFCLCPLPASVKF